MGIAESFSYFFRKYSNYLKIIWKSSPLKQFDLFEPNLTWVVILKVCPFRIASDDRANPPTILNKMVRPKGVHYRQISLFSDLDRTTKLYFFSERICIILMFYIFKLCDATCMV
jgi:hypothetical protein